MNGFSRLLPLLLCLALIGQASAAVDHLHLHDDVAELDCSACTSATDGVTGIHELQTAESIGTDDFITAPVMAAQVLFVRQSSRAPPVTR